MTDQLQELEQALDDDTSAEVVLAKAVQELQTELQTVQQVNASIDLSGAIAKAHALKEAMVALTGTAAQPPVGSTSTGTADQGSTGTADQASAGTTDQGGATGQGSTGTADQASAGTADQGGTTDQGSSGTVAPVSGSADAGTNDSGGDPVVA